MAQLRSLVVLALLCLFISASVHAATYDVKFFGAAGDNKTKDTAAIQAAIDKCSQSGGGTVYFPAGDYLSGALRLQSRVVLHLDPGATVWSSRDPADYEDVGRCLLNGEDLEDVAITGCGTLHGIGEADLGRRPETKDKEQWPEFRAGILRLDECKNISLRGFVIRFSDTWTINLRDCDNVFIDGLSILNNYFRTNSDGIDPVSCRNVHISNCHIVAGDDCIVLKSSGKRPCENVVITNCTLETIATAVKLGTESPNDFRNIHFSNCTIRNSTVGIGLFLKDGGAMERVTFSHIDIENSSTSGVTNLEKTVYPIFVDIERRNPDSKIGTIRDLSLDHIQIVGGQGVLIQGMPQSAIENLSLSNVTFRVDKPADYSARKKHIGGRRTTKDERDTLYARQPSYVTLAHVRGLTVDNLRVQISDADLQRYDRSALAVFQSADSVIRNVFRQAAGSGKLPVISLDNCRNALVTACIAAPKTPLMVGISGMDTAAITVNTAGIWGAARPVVRSDEVPEKEVGSRE